MNTLEMCDLIESGDYEQLELAGQDIEDLCETLAMRYRALYEAAKSAEAVMTRHIYPKPDVGEDHPWSILKRLREELSQ